MVAFLHWAHLPSSSLKDPSGLLTLQGMRPSPDSSSIPFSLHKKKVLLGRRPRKIPLSHLFQYTRGGLSTATENEIGFTRACLPWALGSSLTPGNHDALRLGFVLPTRTRRAHPSEKITFRLISGTSPQDHRNSNRPPRGGAGSARPRGTLALDRGMCPPGHKAFTCPR